MAWKFSCSIIALVVFIGSKSATAQVPDVSSLFSVDGFALGSRVQPDSHTYRAYRCEPSEQYPGLTWCHRSESEQSKRGAFESSHSILHSQDGSVLYTNKYLEPAFWDPNEVASDITRLTKKFGKQPNITRMPHVSGEPEGVMATWGDVLLERLDKSSIDILSTGKSAGKGIIVDFIGNFQRSAKKGLPVYRLTGGPGYVWAASFNKEGRGTLRFFAIDPASLIGPMAKDNPTPRSIPHTSGGNGLQIDRFYRQTGNWNIGYVETLQGCVATASSDDQTSIWIGANKSPDAMYVAFTSPKWKSIESGRQYGTEIRSTNGTWNGQAVGFDHGDYEGLVSENVKREFLDDLLRSSVVSLSVNGQSLSRVSLVGLKAAKDEMIACQDRTPVAGSGAGQKREAAEDSSSSGTGIFVLSKPHDSQRRGGAATVLTNYHVVRACPVLLVSLSGSKSYAAQVIAQDEQNDLALITTDLIPDSVPAFRVGARLGEAIEVYGYPLSGLLATSGNFTAGTITAMAGMGDDTRFFQISAPVQPGNSGGPVLGNVVGIVTSKLNALKLAPLTDDVAQNINFSLKAATVLSFLEANNTIPDKPFSTAPMDSPDIAADAKTYTARIVCQSTPQTSARPNSNELGQFPATPTGSDSRRLFGVGN
jgi:serine protease Do